MLPSPSFLSSPSCLGVASGVRRIFGTRPGEWVLLVEYRRMVFFGTRALLGSTVVTCSTGGFGRISAFFFVAVNSNPEAFRSPCG